MKEMIYLRYNLWCKNMLELHWQQYIVYFDHKVLDNMIQL